MCGLVLCKKHPVIEKREKKTVSLCVSFDGPIRGFRGLIPLHCGHSTRDKVKSIKFENLRNPLKFMLELH